LRGYGLRCVECREETSIENVNQGLQVATPDGEIPSDVRPNTIAAEKEAITYEPRKTGDKAPSGESRRTV